MNSQRNDQALFFKYDDLNENDRVYIDPLTGIHDRLSDDHQNTIFKYKTNKHEDRMNDPKQENEQLLSADQQKISSRKSKPVRKFHPVHSLIERIHRLKLTKHHIIMIILDVLMVLVLILVFEFSRRSSFNLANDAEKVLVMKRGNPYGGPGGEELWDDAEIAILTFNATITRVSASQSVDLAGRPLLLSLTFGYSNERIGREYGGIGRQGSWNDPNSFELSLGERIVHITIYEGFRNITNSWREGKLTYIIVGIYFKTDRNQEVLYGSSNGIQKEESPRNYFLAYAQGKAVGYIDSLRFTWYKYCSKNSKIIEETTLSI